MKFRYLIIALLLIIAACSSPTEAQISGLNGDEESETQTNPESIIPEDTSPAVNDVLQENVLESQARATLAGQFQSFFLDPDKVKVIDSREVEWSDSCLGIDQPGVECTPQVTKGYEIKLEANGLQFDYHADQDGSKVQPATLGLIWTRQGGDDQLCDRLIIYLPDIAHTCWCNSGEMHATKVNLQEILSMEEYEQFIDLMRYFSKNSINHSAPDASAQLNVELVFHGQGSTNPQSADQQTLLTMAENIFDRVNK
jgi:hypothetical protein